MFDWPTFLNRNNIEFVTSGPNVAKHHIAVHCPFCGAGDPSQHMSISLRGRGWRCWRNPTAHSGRSPTALIQALLQCPWEEARSLAGHEPPPSAPDQDLAATVAGMLGAAASVTAAPSSLHLPAEFKPLSLARPMARGFVDYLRERGYSDAQLEWLIATYNLHYAITGKWRYRIIMPLYDARRILQTWTGRTIADDVVRYLSLSTTPQDGYPASLSPPTNLLFGLPLLWSCRNAQTLVLCEGPFDAMRITALGHPRGIYGTCQFGLQLSELQTVLIEQLMSRFRRLVLVLDRDAQLQQFSIAMRLARFRCTVAQMPEGLKDPGELSDEYQLDQLLAA
jgi:hypothetical protein